MKHARAMLSAMAAHALCGAAAAAQTHTVTMDGVAFVPPKLSVLRGDTVIWVNKDPFPHTATAADRSFDSGEIGAGKSGKVVVKKAGTFEYVCTLHPTMKGTLVVK